MKMIMEYKLASENSQWKLNSRVNGLISEGYQPFGSIAVAVAVDTEDGELQYDYNQAMVKYREGQ